MPKFSNGQTMSIWLFCLYCLSVQVVSPLLAVSTCVCIDNTYIYGFFSWTTPKQAIQASSSEIPISPFTPGTCLCTFNFFSFLLKTDGYFWSILNDVSPDACINTTSNFLCLLETSSVIVSQKHVHLLHNCTMPFAQLPRTLLYFDPFSYSASKLITDILAVTA